MFLTGQLNPEGISLKRRSLRFSRVVLFWEGFENGKDGNLYRGKEEIQAETKRLVEETGKMALILGADCTIPNIAVERNPVGERSSS